jgi:plastocyanin
MARLLCTLLLGTALVAGCGGSDAGQKGGRSVTVQPNAKLQVTAKEYRFDPQTIVVGGAGRLTIRLRNDGSLAHDIRVRRGDRDVGGTPSFPAGETRTAALELGRGSYTFLCTVGDHAELGMRGTLTVK